MATREMAGAMSMSEGPPRRRKATVRKRKRKPSGAPGPEQGTPILFQQWLRKFAQESDDALVRQSEEFIGQLLKLAQRLPGTYGWRVTHVEAFIEQGEELRRRIDRGEGSLDDMNRHYWVDIAREIEAYSVLSLWKACELIQDALSPMNAKRVLAPAIVSRSLLELSAMFLFDANTIEDCVNQAIDAPRDHLIVSEQLENQVLKAIWGTRMGKPSPDLKKDPVGKLIGSISKNPNAADLFPTYAYLCDVTHPNVIGNDRFQAAAGDLQPDGSVIIRIDRAAEFIAATSIREKTIWALGWSAYSIGSGFGMIRSSVHSILNRWDIRASGVSSP